MSVKIVGHRGSGRTDHNPFGAGLPPQHTELSFQQVVEDKHADGVEFDIFLSKDNVPIIIDRQGAKNLEIHTRTAAEIAAIPLPDGQHILTLAECLAFLADMDARHGNRLVINAELKGPGVAGPTLAVIEDVASRHPLARDRIYFDALEWDRLSELRALDATAKIMPALSTAGLFNTAAYQVGESYDKHVFQALEDFIRTEGACGIDVMTSDIRPEMIDLAERTKVGFCSYPQGPKPVAQAPLMHRNIQILNEFARRSGQFFIFKVEDVEAARDLIDQPYQPGSVEKLEKVMGMRFDL